MKTTLAMVLFLFLSCSCTFHWVEAPSLLPTVTPTPELIDNAPLLTPLPGETGSDDSPALEATPSCELVKGNIDAKGRKLYHLPGMKNYNQVKIDEAKGEKFFCTEQEAQEAGWTKAKN
jgi:hypothetical protein